MSFDPEQPATVPLFHGSRRALSVGTVLTPREVDGLAFATPHVATAKCFGRYLYRVEPVDVGDVAFRYMRHTQGEYHLEAVSGASFRVTERLVKSRAWDETYDDEREAAWRAALLAQGVAPDESPDACSQCSVPSDPPRTALWVEAHRCPIDALERRDEAL